MPPAHFTLYNMCIINTAPYLLTIKECAALSQEFSEVVLGRMWRNSLSRFLRLAVIFVPKWVEKIVDMTWKKLSNLNEILSKCERYYKMYIFVNMPTNVLLPRVHWIIKFMNNFFIKSLFVQSVIQCNTCTT